jgi:hypothetical protein
MLVGIWIRMLINVSFHFVFLGQAIAAISKAFILNGAASVSARWFGI